MINIFKNKFRVIFVILLLGIGITSYGQDFTYSNVLTATRINVYSINKTSDGFLVFGDYTGTLNGNVADGRDMYLAKYNELFQLQWLDQIGGTLIDFAYDLVNDNSENIYLLGTFKGDCNFEGANTITADGSEYDALLVKYSKSGGFIWARKVAYNEAEQYGRNLDIDINGDIIIGGDYSDSISFDDTTYTSSFGMYIAKYSSDGDYIWSKNIQTTNVNSQLQSLSAFSDGYYFNGFMEGTVYFDLGNEVSNTPTSTDVFLYKTDFNGNGIWLNRSYGDDDAITGTITNDEYGNVYYTGRYGGISFEIDSTETLKANQVLTNNGSNTDIFVLKYNKNGGLIWAKDYGLSGEEWARDIRYQNRFLYITGYFSDTLVFGEDTLLSGSAADLDAFIGMIDRDGNTLKAAQPIDSDNGTESGMELSANSDGDAFWAGNFKSSILTIGDSVYNNPNSGKPQVYITKYEPPLICVFTKKENVSCNGLSDGELTVTPYFGVAPYTYSWSPNTSDTDSTASGLAAGTYTVTVTDAVDSTAVVSYNLTEPGPFTFNPTITDNVACSYSEDGAIDLSVAGGNGGYTYKWVSTNGCGVELNTEDQSGLSAGTYNVTVTDSKSCTGDTTIYISAPDSITFGGSVVTDSSGIGPGAIILSYTGGSGDPASFTFDWQGPSGTTTHSEDTTNLSPGNYTVTVTDVHACAYDTTFNVANLDTFYIYISQHKDACYGTINGSATVSYYSPEGHSGTDITYKWDANAGNQTTAQATNLASGRYYKVTVTDTQNSPNTVLVDSVYIDQLTYDFAGSLSGTSTLDCYGDNDGYIDLTIDTQGEKPYTYSWSNGASVQDLTGLGTGTYSVTVADKYNCQFSITNYSIDQPTAVSAVAEIVNNPSCNGDYDGEVTVDRSGGTSPYTYQWDDPGFQDTRNADGLNAGYYNVTVSDVNGCKATSGINLTEPGAISIAKVIDNEDCNGAGEGSISLTVSGGTIPFTYNWTTTDGSGLVITDKNQSGLTAGKYYVTATDNNNCMYEDSAEVTEPHLLQITNEEKTDITTCYGENIGTITITATGGTGVLTYTLNPGAIQTNTTGSFTGLSAGTYSVDVEDENGCSVTSSSIEISQPTQLVRTDNSVNDATCNAADNGSINITVTGGTIASDYTYTWTTSDGSGLVDGVQDQPTLGAGTYYLTVSDDNSCQVTSNYTLTEPTAIVVTKSKSDLLCNGDNDGGINLTVSGGVSPYSYSWSTTNGSGLVTTEKNQTGLTAGKYYFTVTDDNLCSYNDSVEITEPPLLQITNEEKTDITTCYGENIGTITITATGGTGVLTYTLNPGAIQTNTTGSFTGLSAGTYSVDVEDENGCSVTSGSIQITQPAQLVRTDNSVNDATCNAADNGSINITVTGGTIASDYTYTWTTSDGSGLVDGVQDQPTLGAGTYYLTVSDDNSCQVTSNYTLIEPTAIVVTKSKSDLLCNGDNDGGINLTVSGGVSPYSYTWSTTNGSGLVTTDKNQSGLTAGKYYFTVTDDNLCSYNDSVEITEPPLLQITNEEKTDITTCYGENIGTITITATGGTGVLTYTLNPGAIQTNTTGSFTGLSAGTYSVDIEDENGCSVTSGSIQITQPAQLVRTDNSVNDATCNAADNGSINITVTGGTIASDYTYTWTTSDGSGLVDGVQDQPTLGAGTYYLTVSDDNSCQVTSNYTLTEPTAIVVTKSKSDLLCNGDNNGGINLTVSGGVSPYSYTWSTTNGSGLVTTDKNQSGLTAGKYYFTVTDDNLCNYNDSVEITQPALLEITNEQATNVSTCHGESTGSINITASGGTGGLTYILNPGAVQTNTTGSFTGLAAGTYSVDVVDENLCTVTSSNLQITEPGVLTIKDNSVDDATCHGVDNGSIDISVSGGTIASDYTYTWTTTDGFGLENGVQDQPTVGAGTYYLTVTDDNSCEATSSYTLTEPDTIIITITTYDPACYDEQSGVIVVNSSGGMLPFSYYWTTDDGDGLEPVNRNQGGLIQGTYYVEVTDALGCVLNDTVVLTSPPEITIDSQSSTDASGQDNADGTITVEASGGTGVLTYTLKPDNISNQTGLFTAVLPGDYTVSVRDENYCGPVTTNTITIGSTNDVEDVYLSDKIKMYPNPTAEKLYIEIDDIEGQLNLKVISISGQIILSREINAQGVTREEIDMSEYSKGIYFINIYNSKFNFTNKVILK